MSMPAVESSGNTSAMHMRRLFSHDKMPDETVNALILRFQKNGDIAARNKVIEHHQRLVAKIAHIYDKPGFLEFQDLVAYGNLGLIHAAEKFNDEEGCSFATYAWDWVHNYIRRGIMDSARTVRLPISAQTRIRRGTGMRPTDLVRKIDTGAVSSRDSAADDIGFFGVTYQTEIDDRPDLEEIVSSLETYGLTEREALYFRMHHTDGLDYKGIADKLGVSRQAVNAGLLKAIQRIRKVLVPES